MVRVLLFSLLILWMSALSADPIPSGSRLSSLAPERLAIGGAVHPYDGNEPREFYRKVALREFSAITATAYMAYGGWPTLSQNPNTETLKSFVTWATTNQLPVHGHVLLYPAANLDSDWFPSLPVSEVESTLQRYVTEMAQATAGKMWVWDVVNEVMGDVVELESQQRGEQTALDQDGVRKGIWKNNVLFDFKEYSAMGQAYIDKAFQWAKDADPNALLIINDYAAEELNLKSDALLAFAKKLRARGVPIDGVGFQMHWLDLSRDPDYDSIKANLRRFADAGFLLFFTEVDVATVHTMDPVADSPTQTQQNRQKRIYEKMIRVAIEEPAVRSWLLWDYADDQSWLHPSDRTLGELPPATYMYPTPFWGGDDSRLYPITAKPSYYGMQYALQRNTAAGNRCNASGRTLRSGSWALLSLPCEPPPDIGVGQLFGDDLPGDQNTDWAVYTFNASANEYALATPDTRLKQGEGFWILQLSTADQILTLPENSTLTQIDPVSSGCAAANCIEISLPAGSEISTWNLVGHPFTTTPSAGDLRVHAGDGACSGNRGCSIAEAANYSIIHEQVWYYRDDVSPPRYFNAASDGNMLPWHGYWLSRDTANSGVDLTIQLPE